LRNLLHAIVRTWRRDPEFRTLTILVVVMLISGSTFYYAVEDWIVVDAFYFSVTTLTTVGFGDITPDTTLGKLFTTVYTFAGLGLIAGFINTVAKASLSRGKGERTRTTTRTPTAARLLRISENPLWQTSTRAHLYAPVRPRNPRSATRLRRSGTRRRTGRSLVSFLACACARSSRGSDRYSPQPPRRRRHHRRRPHHHPVNPTAPADGAPTFE